MRDRSNLPNPFPLPRAIPNSLSGVPYRDANPQEDGEIPLDELDTFVIPAQDQNHVSEPVHFRIPPYMRRNVKIVVASGRFPYLGEEDLIRHAVSRHLAWLASIRMSVPQHIKPTMNQISEICADDEMQSQIEDIFKRAEERVKYHMARGDGGEVVRLLTLMRSRLVKCQQSARLREFMQRFDKTYGTYLNGNGFPGLTPQPEPTNIQ